MSDKDFLKFKNEQLSFSEFQQKLGKISEKDKQNLSKLLNIFDSDKNGLIETNNSIGVNEIKNLWDALKNAANKNPSGNNNELDSTELNIFGKEYLKEIDNAQNILTNFANTIFNKDEPVQTTETSNFKNNIDLTEIKAQNQVINTILDDVRTAGSLYFQQDNGKVSDAYDKLKEKDILGNKNLSATKVEEALALQEQTALNLISARDGELTKREYYLQNKEHLKTMLLRRIYEKDENTGLNFLDRNKGNRSKKEFAKFLEDYIEDKVNSIQEIDSIKTIQSRLISLEKEEMDKYLLNLLDGANNKKTKFQGIESRFSIDETIPPEFNSDDPITFEEVFRYERGVEYSKEKVEQLISKTQERQMSIGAFNKFQVYKNGVNELLKDSNSLTSDKIIEFYQAYYENSMNDNLAKEKLSELIAKSKLPISLIETNNGKINIDLSAISNEENKQRVLVNLLKLGLQEQEKLAVEVLGGKPEDRILAINQDYQAAYNSAYGSDFTEEIVKAMEEDNKTFIQKYTGEASTGGMVLIGLGAVLCCTPLAPAGGLILASGNALALGGMVAESGLGTYEAKTRDKVDEAELEDLKKTAIMNAGGFIVGFSAGKLGMKVFNKLVDKKLATIFKDKLSNIGRKEALKEVFTNPEMLKNFATAGGAKLSTDFLISYAGDLMMMGILDPKDDWKTLLQSNLMGIMVGSASDIADVGKLALKKKTVVSNSDVRLENPVLTQSEVRGNFNADSSKTELNKVHQNDQINHVNQIDEGIQRAETISRDLDLYSYKELFENKKIISNQEANNILRKYNLTETDIAEIRNIVKDTEALNAYIYALDIVSKYEGDLNFNEMTVKEIKESLLDIESDSEQIEIMKLINPDNLKQIKYMFKTNDDKESIELLVKLWEEVHENPNYENLLNKSIEIFNQTGAPFKDILDRFATAYKYYPEEIEQLTPERIIANGQITKALGIDYYFGAALSIKDPSKITPEFIQEFKVEYDKLKNLNIDTNYNDPIEALAEFKKLSEFSKKYGFDFSWNKKRAISRDSIIKLLNRKDPSKAKEFIDNIPEEFKDKYADFIMSFATREEVLINSQDYLDFFKAYARIESFAHMSSDASTPTRFISELNNIGVKDIGGVAKMLEAFNEVNAYPSWNSFFKDFNLKNGDYEEAAKYIKSLPELFNEDSYSGGMKNSVNNYITYNWKPDIDFKIANIRVKALKEKNLIFDMDKNILQTIVSSKNDNIVEIFALLKDYGVSYDGTISAILANDKLSMQQLQEKIDVITNKLIEENPDSENIDPKFLHKLINSKTYDNYTLAGLVNDNWDINKISERYGYDLGGDLDIKYDVYNKYKDKFNTPDLTRTLLEVNSENFPITKLLYSNDDFSDRMIGNILGATNKQNIKLAEKLCLDKEFPKNFISEILSKTNEKNIAIAEKLCSDKDFPKDVVSFIVFLVNEQNIKMAEFLYENKDFPPDKIADIIRVVNEENINYTKSLCIDKDFPKESIPGIVRNINNSNIKYAEQLFAQYKSKEISISQFSALINNTNTISYKDIQRLRRIVGRAKVDSMNETDLIFAAKFSSLLGKQNINEIPIEEKRGLLRKLVANNIGLFEISDDVAKDFPLIPRNQEEYCTLLPALVRSLGVDVTPLRPEIKVENFNNSMSNLSQSLAKLSDNDFANISITQEYSKDDFIKTVLDKVKDLSSEERQKVYDYYGFELHRNKGNKETGFSITGYPVNLNNGKTLTQITDSRTKEVVENLRADVIKFSENNPIKSNNLEIEQFLNEIVEALPELRTTIGKVQHLTHDFDIMQHSLKVMQKVAQDPKFNELSESDKKIMMLASLMHDIRKREGFSDPTHADESSFDTFFIGKKFNLSKNEEIKLYTLIKHHEWLQYVNTARDYEGNISPIELEKRLQSVAYDLQQDNLFDMAMMFTHADLKAVKSDNRFHDTTIGKGRVDATGKPTSYGDLADIYATKIKKYVVELQKSQPLLPVTKIPTSSVMKQAITYVNSDGSTNLKGVYVDKEGLIVLKYNEVEDWEALGFPKGSISRGISAKGLNNNGQETDVDTGNIKFFVHGLDYANQLAKFDAFGLVDSDVLLSVSYAERPESKYRFFRTQGVLLDVDTKYIHGGGNTDSGSGCGKSIADFKKNYIFGGNRESDRLYISNMIKDATGMSDSEYVKFVKENENKPFTEIEPKDVREKIIKAFATINSNVRKGNREYNEMYVSNPNVMGVFAYSPIDKVGNVINFVKNNSLNLDFLKKFALERDIPMIVFGD